MNVQVREIAELSPDQRDALFEREAGVGAVAEDVREIVDRVREEGDAALREFTAEFDDVKLGSIDVTSQAERAADQINEDVRTAICDAAENIRTFHERQVPEDWREQFDGRELGRRFRPLKRAGVYVPGGTAAYPSSALMGIIPAKVAGVEHVAVATPPAEKMNPVTLAAIHEAGADRVYSIGGAQAIAGLAYGTESVKSVQKIVGPGNVFVTAAKAAVRGAADIDFLAGPSEVLVIADETADPRLVASELVAQAEHDTNTSVVAVTDDRATAEAVGAEVEQQIEERERREIIEEALENDASGVLLARSQSEAILFAEEYAAEHLSIMASDDEEVLARIDSAGSVFVGPNTPVAAGDYASGTNHVLPTNGGARVHGGLSVDHFMRSTTVQRLDHESLAELSDTVKTLAKAEGLEAHATSIRHRFEE
jgi:histidinol dehydrogenase